MTSNPDNLPAIPGRAFGLHHDEIMSAVELAMKNVGVAVQLMMGHDNPQRFMEAKKLVSIGQALSRTRGRLTRRVGDVGPRRSRYRGFVCGSDDVVEGNLEDDPYDDEGPAGGPLMANPMAPMAPHIGAPRLGGGDDTMGEVAGMLGPMVEQFVELSASRDKPLDRSRIRLDRSRELETLIQCRNQLPEDERSSIQLRIDAVMKVIAAPDPETEHENKEEEDPKDYDPADVHDVQAVERESERQVYCACGNSHGEHWVTEDGSPRNCDVCNAPMSFDRPELQQPAQPQHQGLQ